jgi:Na+-driven multidrug efflux pump
MALVVRHFGGPARIRALASWPRLLDTTALKRVFGLSRDLMIRSAALMSAFGWFTAQTSRLGEVPLAANELLMHFTMVTAFFLDGQAQAAEQLCGKAVGANYRPAFGQAMRLSLAWGMAIGFGLFVFWLVAGGVLIDFMTTSEPVRMEARMHLTIAALTAFTGVLPFVMDGIMTGATLNTIIRNGMLVSLAIYLAAAAALQPAMGVTGLWLAIHVFFVARGVIFLVAVQRKMPSLFPA